MRTGMMLVLLPLLLAFTGCMAVTEHYQKAVYGHALEPGIPCKKGDVWKNMECRPGPPKASAQGS